MTICCQLSNHCHCSLQLDDWILKEENKKFNWNLQDSILRKKHWRPTEGLTVGGEATETKHGAWRWHQGLPLPPVHWAWVLSFLGSFSSPVSCRPVVCQVSSADWIPCQFLHFSPFRWSWCWPGRGDVSSSRPDCCSRTWCSGTTGESAGGPRPENKAQITSWSSSGDTEIRAEVGQDPPGGSCYLIEFLSVGNDQFVIMEREERDESSGWIK